MVKRHTVSGCCWCSLPALIFALSAFSNLELEWTKADAENCWIFALPNGPQLRSPWRLQPSTMTYRLITALRQFYKRREHVTKMANDEE